MIYILDAYKPAASIVLHINWVDNCVPMINTNCAEYIGIPWLQLLFRCEGLFPGAGYPEGGDSSGSHTGALRQDQVIH